MQMHKLAMIIVDGWGMTKSRKYNAFHAGKLSFIPWALQRWPNTLLRADGVHVGLPEGVVGNSEVGHLHLGVGRVVRQPLMLVNDLLVQDGLGLQNNLTWTNLLQRLRKSGGSCHVIGLISSGHVHGSHHHMMSWVDLLSAQKIKCQVHAITDGRDSAWDYGLHALEKLPWQDKIQTISGRFYAMDRDRDWLRTLWVAEAILEGDCSSYQTYRKIGHYLKSQYHQGCGDEFVQPAVREGYAGVQPEDVILIINFRHDRVKQLLQSLVGDSSNLIGDDFETFKDNLHSSYRYGNRQALRKVRCCSLEQIFSVVKDRHASYVGQNFLVHIDRVNNGLAEVLSRNNMKQLRVAESEKAPHVTWFFNGGHDAWPEEDWSIVPSIRCTSWNHHPGMSASLITEAVINRKKDYDFILVNYANCDLVAHSGDFNATIMAARTVDEQLELLSSHLLKANYKVIITSDHGNAEQMVIEETGMVSTGHTNNPVHCIFLGWGREQMVHHGSLIDVAPTILKLYGIDVPGEMKGRNLIY